MTRHRPTLLLALAACAISASPGLGAPITLTNPSLEEGDTGPRGWTLDGAGHWGTGDAAEGRRFVAVTGGGGQWRSDPLPFVAGATYELRVRYRYHPAASAAGSYAVIGPDFALQTVGLDGNEQLPRWHQAISVFTAPASLAAAMGRLVLGEWQLSGAIDYDALELHPALLAHRMQRGLTLGAGERLEGNDYTFNAPLATALRNASRPLESFNDRFHEDRWRFTRPDSTVVYRHELAGRKQTRAKVEPNVWFHEDSSWGLAVEVSTDGKSYRNIGVVRQKGGPSAFDVPPDMLPADAVWVRLRTDTSDNSKPTFFQCTSYGYSATVDGGSARIAGETALAVVLGEDPALVVAPEAAESTGHAFSVRVSNRGQETVALSPTVQVTAEGQAAHTYQGEARRLSPGDSTTVTVPYEAREPGTYALEFALGGALLTRLATTLSVGTLEATEYGERLPSPDPEVALWWASSGWKVSRTRPAPTASGSGVHIELARNEAEAAQMVVRPTRDLHGLSATASELVGPDGAKLPASAVEVLRVRYVTVAYASDALGGTGDWPDPLPPFRGGISVAAGENQPLWVRVRAPKEAPAATYRGTVTLQAEGFRADVPLEVQVYGFTLPDEATCRSLFGFSPDLVTRYHKLTADADRRLVMGKYLQSFADHRISPYNPAPLDAFSYRLGTGLAWDGGRLVTGDVHAGQHALLAEDATTTGNPIASQPDPTPISGKPLRLSLWYRTAQADQPAFLYLFFSDATKQWMSGRNRHVPLPASPTWREFTATLEDLPEGAAFARAGFQGCEWTEQGEHTGSVWVDDLSLVDTGSGRELVPDGSFETTPKAGADPTVTFDWSAWDAAMALALQQYHFNGFLLNVPGLGGGTFYSRAEGSLGGFAGGTPEYKALLKAWCTAAREHLAAKGLLDKAVVYPFDEPDVKDYPFVAAQLGKLKEYFPGLRRLVPMTLNQPEQLVGLINLWCPIMNSHRRDFARERQRAGDQYIWYICCGPKAPYIANFIDRPATDLRVWLWQTWQEGVDGILIWESTWWTSPEAFPDVPQNPYEDSMSYVSGYGTKTGAKARWNAGDGRFMYPPEAATALQQDPVLAGPVSSIRWEVLRDGVEDFEYLAMLKRLLTQKRGELPAADVARYEALLAVPASISASLTSYTRDPAPIEARRREIAHAIEELTAR